MIEDFHPGAKIRMPPVDNQEGYRQGEDCPGHIHYYNPGQILPEPETFFILSSSRQGFFNPMAEQKPGHKEEKRNTR